MTALQVAKSRSLARTETHVAFRGAVSNPEWEGMSVTIAEGDGNGGSWGDIGQPERYTALPVAMAGSATSVTLSGDIMSGFQVWDGSIAVGGRLRVFRAVSGVIQLIRTADITAQACDCWSRISPDTIITGNSFEYQIPNISERTGNYTFGVARIGADGRIGPVATTTVAVTGPTYTVLTPATPTTGASRGLATAAPFRNAGLAAVTGLTGQVRAGTTHNIQLSWTAGAPDEFVVFINWDGASDRLSSECTLSFASGPAVQAGDMLVIESAPLLTINPSLISRRVRLAAITAAHCPNSLTFGYSNNVPGGRTWQYVAYDGGTPKPDATYPSHYLRLNGTASLPARAQCYFHSGTDQDFYDILTPGRTYRAEIIARAGSAMNATFAVESATVTSATTVALTTTPQTFTFDFSRATLLKSSLPQSWSFTGAINNVSIDILSVRVWDTTRPYNAITNPLPAGIDVRDHHLIKQFPTPSLNAITSRPGFGPAGWTLASLLATCAEFSCNPHFQIEWFMGDEFYYDLVTFLYAPASSGEPLALKREALGFGPVNVQFPRHLYEDGNERWNPIMWAMYQSATDSVTAQVYTQGQLCAMFAARRRAVMQSNPYWPASNSLIEFAGGRLNEPTFSSRVAEFPGAAYTSTALYTSGTDVNRFLVQDNKERWQDVITISEVNHRPLLSTLIGGLTEPKPKIAVYEAGPGYQLSGLNGVTVTAAEAVTQECITKSIGGTTALMASVALTAQLGVGPYNFFTWGEGPYWQAARRASEGGGLYRVASFLKQTYDLLGKCRIYNTTKFIDRKSNVAIVDLVGTFLRNELVSDATVYHFESLTYPGRHGILYVNRKINRDAFGVGHPDYQAGVTGAADFRYHTGLPASAVPFKVLRNEGNMRHHDAYKVGFRPNVVGGVIDGYVADPLCVDLTLTPEDFTVDDPTLRTLTLLGGNCRLEVFTT